MKRTLILSVALVVFGMINTSCQGKLDSCVERYMDEGLSQSEAEDKCDEAMIESVQHF